MLHYFNYPLCPHCGERHNPLNLCMPLIKKNHRAPWAPAEPENFSTATEMLEKQRIAEQRIENEKIKADKEFQDELVKYQQLPTTKESNMIEKGKADPQLDPQLNPNPKRAYQRVTYIYGRVAQQMTAEEITGVIKSIKIEIDELKKLDVGSERIDKEIARKERDLARIVAYLDKRSY